jgi:hypothetical protein
MRFFATISMYVFFASLCLAASALWFTFEAARCVWGGDGFGSVVLMSIAVPAAGIALLVAVVPSAVLHVYGDRSWMDRASLWTSASSWLLVKGSVNEIVLFC